MPQGRAPTPSMRRTTWGGATSTTATDSPRPHDTYSVLPSGDSAVPMGRGPSTVFALGSTLIVPTGLRATASTTVSWAPFSDVTNAVLPSCVNAIERGRGPVGTRARTSSLLVDTAATMPS